MTSSQWNEVALAKLSNVLGSAQGEEVYVETLRALVLDNLGSADDLFRFAQLVKQRDGFVGAVGALLSVHAVMHGATSRHKSPERP